MSLLRITSASKSNNFFSSSELNIENKERSNLLPWKGQFSPQLLEALLNQYSQKGDKVLDPFLGSGTSLIESARFDLEACGIELNPAAFKMARIYMLCNSTIRQRETYLFAIEKQIRDFIECGIVEFDLASTPEVFFSNLVLLGHAFEHKHEKNIFEVLILLLDPTEKELTTARLELIWKRLKDLILNLPYVQQKIMAHNADSRNLNFLQDRYFDLVITSPPYINVFNYHQQKRFAVEALGSDILTVARAEIGSNRKHRQNRFLTVTQYCLDMSLIFSEISKKLKIGAKIIFVVGRESNVRKTSFFNSQIIASLADALGLPLIDNYEREFKNRFGQIIKEDLLIFENCTLKNYNEEEIRVIAENVLTDALERSPKDSRADLIEAINSIYQISPSELFNEVKRH